MKNLRIALILIILAVLQATLLNYFRIFGIKPNLLLGSAVVLIVLNDFKAGFFYALFSGVLLDALGMYRFGINTLFFCLLAILIAALSRKVFLGNKLYLGVLVFLAALLNSFLARWLNFSEEYSLSAGRFFFLGLLEAGYTCLASVFFLRIYQDENQDY